MTFPVTNPCSMLACQGEAEAHIYIMVSKPTWVLDAGTEIEIEVPVCVQHRLAILEVTKESND